MYIRKVSAQARQRASSGRYVLEKRITNKGVYHFEAAETEQVHFSDVTNPDMFIVDVEPEWRLGQEIIELRYMADQLVCKDYDPSSA